MVLPLATFDLHFDRPVNVQQGSKLTSAYVPRASSDLLNNLSETFFDPFQVSRTKVVRVTENGLINVNY